MFRYIRDIGIEVEDGVKFDDFNRMAPFLLLLLIGRSSTSVSRLSSKGIELICCLIITRLSVLLTRIVTKEKGTLKGEKCIMEGERYKQDPLISPFDNLMTQAPPLER